MSHGGLGLTGVEPREISCPYCGETIEILVDPSEERQSFIEGCHVCGRPINITVVIDAEGELHVHANPADDA
jgi:hypothetical protein